MANVKKMSIFILSISVIGIFSFQLIENQKKMPSLSIERNPSAVNQAVPLISIPDTLAVHNAINSDLGEAFASVSNPSTKMLPFYMLVPMLSNLPIDEELKRPYDSKSANPAIVVQYRQSRFNRPAVNQIGLRVIGVNLDSSREETAKTLARSGLIKTGDIILSYRPEWYGTLRYSHVQLGISHAGIAYVDKNSKGELTVYNLDMPLNEDMIGADRRSTLSATHYREAPFLHILRPRGLNDSNRANLLAWIKMLRDQSKNFYNNNLSFNQDYATPNFRPGEDLNFVADLARLAYGSSTSKNFSMFCSEFAWSVLSLKDCNPESEKNNFTSGQGVPECIRPIFQPMNTLGTIAQKEAEGPRTLGLADGPVLLADAYTRNIRKSDARNQLLQRMFREANGAAENISSGHRAVEESILKGNPKFFDQLLAYYKMTGLPADQRPAIFNALFQGFNAGQKANYSPTAFQIHANLPREEEVKAMDYVGTLVYIPGKQYKQLLNVAVKFKK